MYYRLSCKLSIGEYQLRGVNSIEVKCSIHSIIQTATVHLPLSVVFRNNDMMQRIKLADKIKEGDPIRLEFGYNDDNSTEFQGYIRRIDYSTPLQLFCEDELYILRRVRIKKSFGKCTLNELLAYLLDEVNAQTGIRFNMYENMPQLAFKNFIMNNVTGIEVLQELKDKYGLRCFLTYEGEERILFCGLAYQFVKDRVNYHLGRNTISLSELKYDVNSDRKFKIKVKNYRRDGSIHAYEFGDRDGQEYEMQAEYGDHNKQYLEALAKAEEQRLKAQGFRGSFETFLRPGCQPGTIASIYDPQFPERRGNYYIAAVTTTFGTGGGRRKPEIGIKV